MPFGIIPDLAFGFAGIPSNRGDGYCAMADLILRTIPAPTTIMIGDKKVVTSSGRKILR